MKKCVIQTSGIDKKRLRKIRDDVDASKAYGLDLDKEWLLEIVEKALGIQHEYCADHPTQRLLEVIEGGVKICPKLDHLPKDFFRSSRS